MGPFKMASARVLSATVRQSKNLGTLVRCFSISQQRFATVEGEYENIVVEVVGEKENVGVISLNRPKALNSLCDALITDLENALNKFQNDPNIGAVVLTGKGKAFAAGADIKEMQDREFADVLGGGFLNKWNCLAE